MKETVGERIKRLRIERKMSVGDLAAKTNKSRATIYRYEGNEIEDVPYTVLEPIAKALNVSPSYLIGYENEQTQFDSTKNATSEGELKLLECFRSIPEKDHDLILCIMRSLRDFYINGNG